MVGGNRCALAINIMVPFLDGDDNGHQLTLMGGVISGCTGQFLAIVCHWLHLLACILLQSV